MSGVHIPRPAIAPWLRDPIRAASGTYGQVALAAVMINLFALLTSLFSLVVYNRIVPNNATSSLVALSVGVVIVLVFDFVLKSLRGYFIDIAGQRIDREVGTAIFERLLAMPLAAKRGPSGAFAGLLREFETLRDFFASATLAAIVDVPFVLLFLAVIALIGGKVVIVPLAMIPLVVGTALVVRPMIDRLSAQGLGQGLSKQGVLVETTAGLETIKTTAAGELFRRRWAKAVSAHSESSLKLRLVGALPVNVAGSAQSIAYIGIVVYGVTLVGSGELTQGALIACSILGGRCVTPLTQIATLLGRLSHTRSAYRELDAVMSGAGERTQATPLRRPSLAGDIEFRGVSFGYPGADAPVLSGVSFRIAAGERVGVLGAVGSGKSTLTRLILGLYEPTEGAVLIDGSDVRQLHPDDLRAAIGAVPQEVFLLSGTVRENIALDRDGIDDAELLRVAKVVGVHDFVGLLPNGYDLVLGDRGEGLSGGQRQAIAIARALAGAKPVLLLDEPTSAMDTRTEATLTAALQAELAGRTLVLVTHRAALLKLVDKVIVLDGGRLVAFGPRDEVLKALPAGAGG